MCEEPRVHARLMQEGLWLVQAPGLCTSQHTAPSHGHNHHRAAPRRHTASHRPSAAGTAAGRSGEGRCTQPTPTLAPTTSPTTLAPTPSPAVAAATPTPSLPATPTPSTTLLGGTVAAGPPPQ